jgi:hypothetical protein
MSGWQEAMGVLARERELAESAGGLLKAHARDTAAMARGRLLYGEAKAASDALIERLLVAVREADDPDHSPDLRAALVEAVVRRESFTAHSREQLPATEGTRSATIVALIAALAAAKPAAEAVKALADAISTLWKTGREGRELDRQALTTRLTAQRWRVFTDLPEVQ